MKRDWEELTATSYYGTVAAIQESFDQNDLEDARHGVQTLLDTMSQQLKSALHSQLIRLMKHIIKWNSQPERRSASWVASIDDARQEIEAIQATKPSLNQQHLETIWESANQKAARQAANETGLDTPSHPLTWADVFESEYRVQAGRQR